MTWIISIYTMLSWLYWEGSCKLFSSNKTRILWWKYISFYRRYWIGTFWWIYQRQILIQLHHPVNVMQCFTLSYMTITNRILKLLLHTASVWFHCSKTKKYWQHHWLKYRKRLMVVSNNIYVPLHFTLCQLCISVTPL